MLCCPLLRSMVPCDYPSGTVSTWLVSGIWHYIRRILTHPFIRLVRGTLDRELSLHHSTWLWRCATTGCQSKQQNPCKCGSGNIMLQLAPQTDGAWTSSPVSLLCLHDTSGLLMIPGTLTSRFSTYPPFNFFFILFSFCPRILISSCKESYSNPRKVHNHCKYLRGWLQTEQEDCVDKY